jgi:hypothetical protein
MGRFVVTDDCAYWAMRRETGQLSLNVMTMIQVSAILFLFLSTNTVQGGRASSILDTVNINLNLSLQYEIHGFYFILQSFGRTPSIGCH